MNVVTSTPGRHVFCTLSFCLLTWIGQAVAQPESAAATDADAEAPAQTSPPAPEDRDRILYIDVPVPLQPGVDPVLPPPFVSPVDEQDQEYQRRVQVIRDYNEAIVAIEAEGGAWDRNLVEELEALGTLQQQQGNHAEAIETLGRAMHIDRINNGLHTLQQVPVVEHMIDSYMALGDWASVDLYQNYLYYVQRKAYGVDDPRIIPVLHRLGEWNVEAFNIGFGDPLGVRLSTAQMLFNTAANMVGIHFGRSDERYVPYMRSIATSAYLASTHPDYMREVNRPEFRTAQDALRHQLHLTGREGPQGFYAGEQALLEIVRLYHEQGDEPFLLAEAVTNLADWNLIFGRNREASDLYADAWQILSEQDNSEELIDRLFGQVIPIPTFSRLPTNLLLGASDSQDRPALHYDYADVRLDVTENGAAVNVEILSEETEANARQLSRLRREIRGTEFRPLLVDGVPQTSEGHLFRYRYWY